MTKLSVLTVSILALCVRPIQSAGHDFTLGLRGPKNAFAGGPIPITLALTYGGVQPISVGSIEYSLRHVHFSTPGRLGISTAGYAYHHRWGWRTRKAHTAQER